MIASKASLFIRVIFLIGFLLHASTNQAVSASAITSDGKLGTTVTQGGTTYNITGGTRNGSNLFHSLGLFSVGTGDTANFLNDNNGTATKNIVGRVTGGEKSSIYGTIQTTNFGAANLFLINPSGWVFGPTAALSVGGSFHVSTADYLKFADGAKFYADLARESVLTSEPVSAFGFLSQNPAGISVKGGPAAAPNGLAKLQVEAGQTLSLVGGDITITGESKFIPTLSAPSGKIQLASVASPGEVPLGIENTNLAGFSRLGKIEIEKAQINASGAANGSVVIRGGRLLVNASGIFADTEGNGNGAATGIDVHVTEDIVVTNNSFISADVPGSGNGGDIEMTADRSLVVTNDSEIKTNVPEGGLGNAGDIKLTADSVELSNSAEINSHRQSASSGDARKIQISTSTLTLEGSQIAADGSDAGNGGHIVIEANNVKLTGGARIGSDTDGSGKGGTVQVTAHGNITLDGADTQISASTGAMGSGSGDVVIAAMDLTLTAGAAIKSDTGGSVKGGTVQVTAHGNITLDGADTQISASTGDENNVGGNGGPGGDIMVTAQNVTMTGGALIRTETSVSGKGGTVQLAAKGNITLDGENTQISASTGNPGGNGGPGGDIIVTAQNVTITGGAGIKSDTSVSGDGGKVRVTTTGGNITLDGTNFTGTEGRNFTGIFADATSTGGAGDIVIEAKNVTLTGGARIGSDTFGETLDAGKAGKVRVTASDTISLTGASPNGEEKSQISSKSSFFGDGGNVEVRASQLSLSDGATITVTSEGAGNAGDIVAEAKSVTLTGGAQISSDTLGSGNGRTVRVTASELVSISGTDSGLFSTASGTGNAGLITVDAPGSTAVPTLTMADGGKISVATSLKESGAGSAGSISLNANRFTLTGGARVEGSTSGAGQGGSVTVTATESMSISGSGSLPSGLFSTASGTGNAGLIMVAAPGSAAVPTLTMADGGKISVETLGAGNAGSISLNANSVSISGQGTGLFSMTSGTGPGGTINLQAAQLQITDAGIVSANSTGTAASATAGNINVVVSDRLRMENGSMETGALFPAGGNISITNTGSLLHMTNSQVTTSVKGGEGGGGDITIGSQPHPFDFIVLNNSGIHANAKGGPGGNIKIFARTFLSSLPIADAVTATSELNVPGTVNIQAAITNVSGLLEPLPENIFQATSLLHQSCAARFSGGKLSSLAVGSRDGLPLEPGGFMPSPLYRLGSQPDTSITQRKPSSESDRLSLASVKPPFSINWPCTK